MRSFFSRFFVLSITFLSTTLFLRDFLILLSMQPRYHDHVAPPTASRVQCSHRRGSLALACSSTSNSTSSLAGATTAFRNNSTRVHLVVFINLPTAQAYLRSYVRNRAGDGIAAVIRSGGGIQVELGPAYMDENRRGQEIPSLAVALGREDLRCGDSWNVRHTFGWATPGILVRS